MSKYQYHPVESLSDLDLTFETKYYCFEEGVGHMEISSLQELSLKEIQSMIDDKWYTTCSMTPLTNDEIKQFLREEG